MTADVEASYVARAELSVVSPIAPGRAESIPVCVTDVKHWAVAATCLYRYQRLKDVVSRFEIEQSEVAEFAPIHP